MGRRKKEPAEVHREAIAAAAEQLFGGRGIEASTMDDIARAAGYSKATLYVYFANKEELVGYLVLKSMKLLHGYIVDAAELPGSVKEKYDGICQALVCYQQQYPLYFSMALGEINIDPEQEGALPVEQETFQLGEQINAIVSQFIEAGMKTRDLRADISVLPTVFLFWSTLAGLVQMASNKQGYIESAMGLSKPDFLEYGFHELYRIIAVPSQG